MLAEAKQFYLDIWRIDRLVQGSISGQMVVKWESRRGWWMGRKKVDDAIANHVLSS